MLHLNDQVGGSSTSSFYPFSLLLLFSRLVVSYSLQPHELQHTKLPCLSLAPRVCSNSCLLSRWHQPTISSSVASFSSCPQSFPTSGSFPLSRLFSSGGQIIGASALASVLPMSSQSWFLLRLTSLISLLSKGSLLQHHSSKAYVFIFFSGSFQL